MIKDQHVIFHQVGPLDPAAPGQGIVQGHLQGTPFESFVVQDKPSLFPVKAASWCCVCG